MGKSAQVKGPGQLYRGGCAELCRQKGVGFCQAASVRRAVLLISACLAFSVATCYYLFNCLCCQALGNLWAGTPSICPCCIQCPQHRGRKKGGKEEDGRKSTCKKASGEKQYGSENFGLFWMVLGFHRLFESSQTLTGFYSVMMRNHMS